MIFFYLLLWILPLIQHPIWGARLGPLSTFECLGLLALVCALVRVAASKTMPQIFRSWVGRLFLCLYLIVLGSALTEPEGLTFNNQPFVSYTSVMALFVLSATLVDSQVRLRSVILVLVGSYAWASLYLIREFQHGIVMWSTFRAGWIVGDSNYFSTGAIFSITLGFWLMHRGGTLLVRYYCLGCLVIILVGLTVCASRGGFLGLAAASLLCSWWTKRRLRHMVMMIVVVGALATVLPVSPLHRWLYPSSSETSSNDLHWQSWQAGIGMIQAHPLVGVGVGRFKREMPSYSDATVTEYHVAHNMFLEVAAELGIPACIVLVLIFIAAFRELGQVRRSVAMPLVIRNAAAALQAAVVGIGVSGSFVSVEYEKTMWVGFALISCVVSLAHAQTRRASRQRLPCSLVLMEKHEVAASY